MAAESNVGARLFLIGKDAVLGGISEITAATKRLNAEIAAGAGASKAAAAGSAEQLAGLERLGRGMAVYQDALLASNAELAASYDAVAAVGKKAFFGLAIAGAAWTYESVKWAQNYQTQLLRLRTQAGLTVTAMNAVGRAAMANAASLGTTPTAYLQAAYHPASTGMSTAETIQITNYAAKEARISGADLEDTTNSLTGVMKSYNLGAKDTAKTMAILNAVVGAGNMRFSDLNSALASGVASTAKTFGISLTSLGGALAFMTDRGVPAAQAGTRLRMAASLLGAPSAQASKFLTDAGLSATQAKDATNSMAQTLVAAGLTTTQLSSALRDNKGAGGIYNALSLLHQHLAGSGMSQEMQAAFISRSFGGGRMGASIEQMYANIPGLGQKSSQIEKGGTPGKFNKDWIATTQTFDFQLHRLAGTVETLGTKFGLDVLPPLTKVLGLFTTLLGILDKNKALVIALGTAVTAILVPAIGLYLYRALLGNGKALRTIITGYKNLITGQTAEQMAAGRTALALDADTAASGRLVTEDAILGGASEATAGKLALEGEASMAGGGGLLAGGARGLAGGLLKGGMLAGAGLVAGSLVRGNAGATLTDKETKGQMVRTVGGDMLEGAGIGAGIGSVVPIIGTGIGAGIGAAAGGIYAERHQIGHAIGTGVHDVESAGRSVWDSIFGGGGSSPKPSAKPIHDRPVVVHVYIDGKEVTKLVNKRTKATAARS